MRINRNRCQQCRFKKCLMVGMSRDCEYPRNVWAAKISNCPFNLIEIQTSVWSAVRFGRIPKREKQRMLLEMQSAMNNMMNSSQLQASPVHEPLSAAPPAAQDVGLGPSCSPSSQSDSSSDPEPAVAMDTSPSASDSGEEEVIGSVTRAHQETFMYNQEQSSLTKKALPATGPAHKRKEEEQQNAWNCRNNLVTMAAQEPPNSQGRLPQEDEALKHCPFRGSRAGEASHTPTYAHGALRAPPTACPASRGRQWRGGNRMYLVRPAHPDASTRVLHPQESLTGTFVHPQVCPMNMSAYVDPQKSGHEVWEEFSQSFTPAVREVVEFAKKIPGFRDLSQHDQVSLLKAGTFEVRSLSPSVHPREAGGAGLTLGGLLSSAGAGRSLRLSVRREEPHRHFSGREEVQHGRPEGHGGRRPPELHV